MAMDRAAKIARLEKIRKLEAYRQAEAPEEAAPQVAGDAQPAGATEWHFGDPATADAAGKLDPVGVGLGTLGAGAKALDSGLGRGTLTAPALAAVLGGLTGKDVYRASEHADAFNPTNLSTFPTASELYERAGVPEGAKLSDYVGGYADPDTEEPAWYQPEKGGLLDPTLRGAGGFATDVAIDPGTWLSFGASGVAKEALKESAVIAAKKAAQKGMLAKGLEMGGEAISKGTQALGLQTAAKKLAETRAGRAAIATAQAPSKVLNKAGKWAYNSMLAPVEEAGKKFGKEEVGETLYNAGIKTPGSLKNDSNKVIQNIMDARDSILQEADDAIKNMPEGTGYASMQDAMAPTMKRIKDYRSSNVPELEAIADQLEQKVKEYLPRDMQAAHSEFHIPEVGDVIPDSNIVASAKRAMGSNTPPIKAGEATIMELPRKNISMTEVDMGKPFEYTKGYAEKPKLGNVVYSQDKPMLAYVDNPLQGVAGKEVPMRPGVTPTQVSRQKTTAGLVIPDSMRMDSAKVAPFMAATSELQGGLRAETERAVGRNLGAKKAADLAELNNEAGKLLSTKKAMQHVENLSNRATNLTGTDTIMLAHDLQAGAIRKTLETMRAKGLMPAGYAARKMAEGQLTGPAIDALIRKTLKDNAGRGSREERVKRGEEEGY